MTRRFPIIRDGRALRNILVPHRWIQFTGTKIERPISDIQEEMLAINLRRQDSNSPLKTRAFHKSLPPSQRFAFHEVLYQLDRALMIGYPGDAKKHTSKEFLRERENLAAVIRPPGVSVPYQPLLPWHAIFDLLAKFMHEEFGIGEIGKLFLARDKIVQLELERVVHRREFFFFIGHRNPRSCRA
jgi:hypothetical protein